MMRELFASKRRAFYGQGAPVQLGPLPDDDVAAELDARFAAGGRTIGSALAPLLELAASHPQRTMLLAHLVWERVSPGGSADEHSLLAALDHALEVDVGDELRTIWTRLPPGQRRVLVAVAENGASLYSASLQRQLGGSRSGSLKAAAERLVDAGELVADPSRTSGYRVVDPLLAYWVRSGRSG